jgi:deoxynucleoside triphosphate triphosphohydrolase SAMHD1
MQMYAKRPARQLEELKRRLDGTGYYKSIAYDVRPVPERLTRADIKLRIERLCERLTGYEGPVRGGDVAKKRSLLSSERVLAWLRQFPAKFADQPLNLLEEMRLVGRADVISSLRRFQETPENGGFATGALCPLGEPKDSSAVTTYWAGDNRRGMSLQVLSLGDALSQPDLPIVFVEDFIGSGQQSISILEGWLGVEPTTHLREERGPLAPAMAEQLRKRSLAFVFAAGQPSGAEELRRRAKELGLNAKVSLNTDSVPKAFDGPSASGRDELREFCRRVGHDLLLDPDGGHDETWATDRALGYGNDACLMLFGYNTPTQTLTCIWKDGVFEGIPWMALFPRRSKQ